MVVYDESVAILGELGAIFGLSEFLRIVWTVVDVDDLDASSDLAGFIGSGKVRGETLLHEVGDESEDLQDASENQDEELDLLVGRGDVAA